MSIANLLSNNVKSSLNLNVNSLEVLGDTTVTYRIYPNLDFNDTAQTSTQAGRMQITTNVPSLPAGAVFGFSMSNPLISENSYVGIMPTLTGLNSTNGFAPVIFQTAFVQDGLARFVFCNPNFSGSTDYTDNELIFNYYILNTLA